MARSLNLAPRKIFTRTRAMTTRAASSMPRRKTTSSSSGAASPNATSLSRRLLRRSEFADRQFADCFQETTRHALCMPRGDHSRRWCGPDDCPRVCREERIGRCIVSFQKIIAIPTIVLSAALTFAPLFAQEAGTGGGQSGNTGTTTRANDDRHPDYGWLGLVGLVGLAGLVRRDKDHRTNADRSINR